MSPLNEWKYIEITNQEIVKLQIHMSHKKSMVGCSLEWIVAAYNKILNYPKIIHLDTHKFGSYHHFPP